MDILDKEMDPVLEGLTEEQLKDLVVRNVKEITRIREDAKAYAKAAREAVKNLDTRNEEAILQLQAKVSAPV